MMMMSSTTAKANLGGKRALLIGLGLHDGGAGVVRYLVGAGAEVTVTDRRDETALAPSLDALAGLPVTYRLGGHEGIAVAEYDLVVRNPGVPGDAPLLVAARAAGVPVEMEMTLFLAACSAPVIGVTGTKGKTTTTAWIGHVLRGWKPETVIAGNMGVSALDQLPQITPRTPVVLELSSFQLEAMGERGLSPHIAVFTNLSPDHLDRYPNFEAYADAKWAIASHQVAGDTLIVPDTRYADTTDDAGLAFLAARVQGAAAKVVPFGVLPPTVSGYPDGAWWIEEQDTVLWQGAGRSYPVAGPGQVSLPGAHNRVNAAAVAAAAFAAGVPVDAVRAGLASFRGVPHRYEDLGTVRGVRYINDTAATAPPAAVAALRTTVGPVVLLAGGSDKGLDFTEMVTAMQTAKAIVLFAGARPTALATMLHDAGYTGPVVGPVASMTEAMDAARAFAVAGDTVLLAPGTASFGVFQNEFDRGEQFRAYVRALALVPAGGE